MSVVASSMSFDGPEAAPVECSDALQSSPSRRWQITLPEITQHSVERFTDRLMKGFEDQCLGESSIGRIECDYDVKFEGTKSFAEKVARRFSEQVTRRGFDQVEWWNGREWADQLKKLTVDPIKQNASTRVRVKWKKRMTVFEDASNLEESLRGR